MTVTEPQAAFLKARLDEDEATARAVPAVPQGELANQAGPCINDAAYIYIRRHDPVRVLREVEAKRAILDEWEDADRSRFDLPDGVSEGRDYDERLRDEAVARTLDAIIAGLAAVYSDHPDYREEG